MTERARPRIVVSRCLGFDAVRYNGQILRSNFVESLKDFVDFVPVCPEVEVGLGIPRTPVRLVGRGGEVRLVQLETGLDVTFKMREFINSFFTDLGDVDGFIMKSRSPSSGLRDVKIYPSIEKVAATAKGPGFFGAAILERYPGIPSEDEGRLTNFSIRERFLTATFALAELRAVAASGRMNNLVAFHTEYKHLLMAYSQKDMRALGKIVAAGGESDFDGVVNEYTSLFREALSKSPRKPAVVNVLQHAAGYFKKELKSKEKKHFDAMLKKYRDGLLPLSALQTLVKSWVLRYEEDYIENQRFFEPYPEELISVRDSGKGVE